MAKYSMFLGRRVHVEYRAGEVNLPASGTMAADSGKSIFLEERFQKDGSARSFRWEIPYQYIVRIMEIGMAPSVAANGGNGEKVEDEREVQLRPFQRALDTE